MAFDHSPNVDALGRLGARLTGDNMLDLKAMLGYFEAGALMMRDLIARLELQHEFDCGPDNGHRTN